MKTAFLLILIHLSISAVATDTFTLGEDSFLLDFEKPGYTESFKAFVAADVERFLTPLGNISNVVDVSVFQTNASDSISLAQREWYPSEFIGDLSVSNGMGTLVFRVNAILSERYQNVYDNYPAVSNQFSQLSSLLEDIADNSITNRTDAEMLALLYLPESSTISVTANEVRSFFQGLHELNHLTLSVLDISKETIHGELCLIAGAKTVVTDETGLNVAVVLWVFKNGTWKFFHPSIVEMLSSKN